MKSEIVLTLMMNSCNACFSRHPSDEEHGTATSRSWNQAKTELLAIKSQSDEVEGWATFVHLLGHGECTCTHGLAADGHLHEASAGPWQSLLEQLKGVVVVEHLNGAPECCKLLSAVFSFSLNNFSLFA